MSNGQFNFFARMEDIKDSTLDYTTSPASKAVNESRSRRLMSLALPPAVYCIHGHIIHQARAVKLSKMLAKRTYRSNRMPQQTRIGRRTAQTSNTV